MKKKEFEKYLEDSKPYLSLCGKKECKDIGYYSNKKHLYGKISQISVEKGWAKVEVLTGRNIMSCGDGPSFSYSIKVNVK